MVVLGRPSLGCVTRAVAAVEGQCTERTAGRTMAESGCLDLDRIEVKQLLCSHSALHCNAGEVRHPRARLRRGDLHQRVQPAARQPPLCCPPRHSRAGYGTVFILPPFGENKNP